MFLDDFMSWTRYAISVGWIFCIFRIPYEQTDSTNRHGTLSLVRNNPNPKIAKKSTYTKIPRRRRDVVQTIPTVILTPQSPLSLQIWQNVCSCQSERQVFRCEVDSVAAVEDVAPSVECRTSTTLTQARFPGAARDFFLPESTFQCRLSYGVCTSPCANTCINICAHVKDPVVVVRVWWFMETLTHPACTVGWVAQLRRSWLSPGYATRISHGRNPIGTIQLWKVLKKKKTTQIRACSTFQFIVLISLSYLLHLLFILQLYCPIGISPMGNLACFPGESQLRQSRATHPMRMLGVLVFPKSTELLTRTTGSLTCTQMLMHAISHRGVRTHVRESALKVDFARKIRCRTGELTLHQRMPVRRSTNWSSYIPSL